MEPIATSLPLLLWGALCAIGDARYRRINNWLTFTGMVVACLYIGIFRQSLVGAAPIEIVVACLLALLFALPGYWRNRLGAGDVKMLFVLALASNVMYLLISISAAAIAILLWLLAGPALWQHLPGRLQAVIPALAPGARPLPYAPFLFPGMVAAALFLQ